MRVSCADADKFVSKQLRSNCRILHVKPLDGPFVELLDVRWSMASQRRELPCALLCLHCVGFESTGKAIEAVCFDGAQWFHFQIPTFAFRSIVQRASTTRFGEGINVSCATFLLP